MTDTSSRKTHGAAGARCVWCHRREGPTKEVTVTMWDRFAFRQRERTFHVHPEHEAAFRAFNNTFRHYGRTFLLAVGGLTTGLLGVAALGGLGLLTEEAGLILAGGLVSLMGGVIIALPFCTPETVRLIGLASAIRLTRVLGGVTTAIGAVMVGFGAFV